MRALFIASMFLTSTLAWGIFLTVAYALVKGRKVEKSEARTETIFLKHIFETPTTEIKRIKDGW